MAAVLLLLSWPATARVRAGSAPLPGSPPPGSRLQWEDCGLEADARVLRLVDYAHSPDPIVFGDSATIRKW